LASSRELKQEVRDAIQDVLLSRHRHQHQKKENKGLPGIGSMADMGRKSSDKKIEMKGNL